jgi:NADH:ubiquinone reductase (H+-translocating)
MRGVDSGDMGRHSQAGVAREHVVAGAAAGLAGGLLVLLLRLAPGVEGVALVHVGSEGAEVALHLLIAIALGALFAVVFRYHRDAYAAALGEGLLLGLLWWAVGALTLTPLLAANEPTWSVADAAAAFPDLVASLLFGVATALGYALLATLVLARRAVRGAPPAAAPVRILILGAGFGGVAAARRLERIFARRPEVEIALAGESNYLLFTPMLAEVASGALEAQHISVPVRAACPRTRFHRAAAEAVDTDRRVVLVRPVVGGAPEEVAYDHLVLAVGSVPTFRGLPGLAEQAFSLKSLEDATELRNHVLAMLERADAEQDEAERRRRLTFVVAGGGFAGTELVAELFDLVHIVLRRYYPHVREDELRFVLVHSRDRILPELSAELAEYALAKLRARGIEFVLGARVEGATATEILLDGSRSIPTRTIVWTAGNEPSPLVSALPSRDSRGGGLAADPTLRVPGLENVWAIGDCAQIVDPDRPGLFYPPTAQHALRQGKTVAANIAAALRGREPKPFRFRTLGLLVGLGHRTAAAEIRGLRFSGFAAWFLWRGIYWSKLPGLEKKLRVALDWTIDLFFPRDIAVTGAGSRRAGPAGATPADAAPEPELVDAGRDE